MTDELDEAKLLEECLQRRDSIITLIEAGPRLDLIYESSDQIDLQYIKAENRKQFASNWERTIDFMSYKGLLDEEDLPSKQDSSVIVHIVTDLGRRIAEKLKLMP